VDGWFRHAGNTNESAWAERSAPSRRWPEVDPVEQRYRRLVDHSPDAIVVHVGGCLVYGNTTAVRWMAAQSSDQLVGHLLTEFVDPGSVGPMLERIAELRYLGDASHPLETVMRRFDGTTLDVEAVAVLTTWEAEPATQVIFRDLTAQKAVQAELRRVEQHFRTVVASLDHGIVVLGRDGRIKSSNHAAQRIFGASAEMVRNWPAERALDFPIFATDGELVRADQHPFTKVLETGMLIDGYVFGVDGAADGRRVWLSANLCLLDPHDPAQSSVLVSFSDITAQRIATERLTYQATHDALTGLPNRAHVLPLLTEALEGNRGLAAVLFIDVDNLKSINDLLGHNAGDEVLRIAARRLRTAVRPEDVIARWSGDEFLALLIGEISRPDIDALADGFHKALAEEPVIINGVTVTIGASMGIVVVDEHDPRGAAQILRDADTAMYDAKTSGRGKSHYFTPGLD
jgi:diguanylate cyclase (GGDEF)-like protein/PAS domain S-box-containing protein